MSNQLGDSSQRLSRIVTGLVNRLSSQRETTVFQSFEKLYSQHIKAEVNNALFDILFKSTICDTISKKKLIADFMVIVAYLSHRVDNQIGASYVHRLLVKFDSMYSNATDDDNKKMENILLSLINLYYIGLIKSYSIFDIAKHICNSHFREKSIELILIILRAIGIQLRNDNPSLMKQLISLSQQKSSLVSDASQRVQFMIDTLNAIKNNNVNKIANYGTDVDRDLLEQTLKKLIQKPRLSASMCEASYETILKSSNWYLLDSRNNLERVKERTQQPLLSIKNKKICKALRLDTQQRQTIFNGLLTATDYVEATNIMLGYGLNSSSDVILVCLQVSLHEKKFNPFYLKLIKSLCNFNRRYKMATKFLIQDKLRELGQIVKVNQLNNFRLITYELLKLNTVPMTIFKAIDWKNVGPSHVEFLKYIFTKLHELPEDEKRVLLSKIDKSSIKLMKAFCKCFIEEKHIFH